MGGIASTIAALGNGIGDGDLGVIRVTQGGDTFLVKLYWDVHAGKWISRELASAIEMTDQDWSTTLQSANATWGYLGGADAEPAKWFLRGGAIPGAGALWAAGLRLQDRIEASTHDDGVHIQHVSPWFYEFNDGDILVFDNDNSAFAGKTWNGVAADAVGFFPSTGNLGHGAVLNSLATADTRDFVGAAVYEDGITSSGYHLQARSAGWDYVKLYASTNPVGNALGGVPTAVATSPTKKYLYPTLYAYGIQDSTKGFASLSWQCRWTS